MASKFPFGYLTKIEFNYLRSKLSHIPSLDNFDLHAKLYLVNPFGVQRDPAFKKVNFSF